MHSFYTTIVGSVFQVNISQCLIQNRIIAVQPLGSQQQKRQFFPKSYGIPQHNSIQQVSVLDGNRKSCWADCSREQVRTASWESVHPAWAMAQTWDCI